MSLEVRAATGDDLAGYAQVRMQAFGTSAADRDRFAAETPPEECLVADAGRDGVVGGLRLWPAGQYLGGRRVPMGGVATVAVRPEWRGRGVAARLLAAALARMRDLGLAVSALHPATPRPYRRMGWELAGDHPRARVATRALEALAPGERDRLRRLGPGDLPAMRFAYDRVAPARPGWLDRPDDRWRAVAEAAFGDLGYAYGLDDPGGGLAAWCRYRLRGHDGPGHRLVLEDLVASDAAGERTLWAFLAASGMQARWVEVEGPSTDALALVLPEQDVRTEPSLAWMARVVDVPAALAARGYPAGLTTEVHLYVEDPQAPWNTGPWAVRVDGGRAEVSPGGAGTVRLDARGLAALVVGATTAQALQRAGRLHGGDAADRARLDGVFAGPRPTMPEVF